MKENSNRMITDEALREELREVLQSTQQYPIDLDDVSRWLSYKLRQRLVTILTTKFHLDEHYTERRMDPCVGNKEKDFKKYFISIECFEQFCKFRKGSRGRKVHCMLIDLKRLLSNEVDDNNSWYSPSSSSSSSDVERESDSDDEVPSSPPCSLSPSPSPLSNNTKHDASTSLPLSFIEDKSRLPHNGHNEEQEDEEDEGHSKSHKRHLDELEEVWTEQNAKMQRVLDKMDDRAPMEEIYWLSPSHTSTNYHRSSPHTVPDDLSSSSSSLSFHDDAFPSDEDDSDEDNDRVYEDESFSDEDVLRLLNL